MNRRKEPCRNFQRGSCQYGDRCKFLHVTQQQPKSNPFGFGSQNTPQFFNTAQQQQKPNPFGFGVQNSSQPKGAPSFGGGSQIPAKPFENKWTRSSSTAPTKSTSSHQADAKPQAAIHKCTDPDSCKQVIVEDFKNEEPLWKLTCYGHCKSGPCDIVGDVSYEELRAAAYEDARRGLPLQAIIEREKNLRNYKLAEFDNLLRNPYVIRNSISSETKMFPGVNSSTSSVGLQSNAPPSFSSFTQLGALNNLGANVRPQTPGPPPNNVFAPTNLSQSSSPSSTIFQQPNFPQNFSPSNAASGWPSVPQNYNTSNTGLFSNQQSQPSGSFPGPNSDGFMANGSNLSSSSLTHFPNITNNQTPSFLDVPRVTTATIDQPSAVDKQAVSPDDSIWLMKEWAIGKIPEQAPPQRFCL